MEGSTANALTSLGTAIESLLTWMGNVVSTITSNPALMLPVAIFIVGGCIGLAKRLIGA